MNKNVELKYDIYQPFGPSVLKIKMPQQFVNLLNAEADRILHDEKLSKEHDWSHNLAGNVKTQFRKVEADEFMVATLLPVQRFKKQSDSHVFAKSRGMV